MQVIEFLFGFMRDFFNKLNQFTFADVPIGVILISFVITSMIIGVFWKGARG